MSHKKSDTNNIFHLRVELDRNSETHEEGDGDPPEVASIY